MLVLLFPGTAMKIGLIIVFAVSCCGKGLIAITQNAFGTTKWDVCLPCWTVSWNTIPHKGQILTYAHHFIGNALLTCRMQEEAGSF